MPNNIKLFLLYDAFYFQSIPRFITYNLKRELSFFRDISRLCPVKYHGTVIFHGTYILHGKKFWFILYLCRYRVQQIF
ncbi:MAG: hypothetical protein LBC02_05635 [Planctomycetaceae bacterium]|nr:hypothetical protein [Planctomycetaceae bacterium]